MIEPRRTHALFRSPPLRRDRISASARTWLRAARDWAASRSPVFWALAAITGAGIVLRLYFLTRYRPALLGYPDSTSYIAAAHIGLFWDPQRVAGYVIFLRLLHAISPHLELVTVVQHGLGIASGLLLFDAVRRTGAPAGLGLVPAAMVMLGGSELMLEHAILTEALFIFLVDAGIWFVVRAWTGSGWWNLAAGVSFGGSVIVRTTGLELLPFVIGTMALAPSLPMLTRAWGSTRLRRLATARPGLTWRSVTLLVGVAGAGLIIVPFLYAHHHKTGSWGFTQTGNVSLYGRVAPWADCSKFTPPPGTAKLCITQPVSQRVGSQAWEFITGSPAYAAYGYYGHPGENAQLQAFALAAIKAQPISYLKFVGRDLLRIIDPSYSSSPNPAIDNQGAGYGPEDTLRLMFSTSDWPKTRYYVRHEYGAAGLVQGNVSLLKSWDRDTRLQGAWMVIVLVLALLGLVLSQGLPRRFAFLCLLTAVVLAAGPVFVLEYSWRYTVPAFGPLMAAAAIGGWGVWLRRSELAAAGSRVTLLTSQARQSRFGAAASSWIRTPAGTVVVTTAVWSLIVQLLALAGPTFVHAHAGARGVSFTTAWKQWDANWFSRIVGSGYHAGLLPPEHAGAYLRAAFDPGYPLVARAVYEVVHPLGISVPGAMILTNQLLIFPMALLVYRLAMALSERQDLGVKTVQYLLLFPFAYFLLAPYSETTFLTFVAGFAWALTTRRYGVAAVLGAAAAATRPVAAALPLVMAVGYLEHHDWRLRSIGPRQALWILTPFAGVVGYVAYQWAVFGSPTYAEHMERIGWGHSLSLDLFHTIGSAFGFQSVTAGKVAGVPLEALINLPLLVAFASLSWIAWRRFGPAMGLMCATFLLIPLLEGTTRSLNRYMLPLLPCFIVLAMRSSRPAFDFAYRTIGAGALALFLMMFTHGIWTG